jgi:MYXO-CTERM domain-containing protein
LAGVTVSTGGPSAQTGADGTFTITGLASGRYPVLPTLAGYTFSPNVQWETVSGADLTGVSFAATAVAASGVTLTPASGVVPPRGSLAFAASGGSGAGYTWTLNPGSGGSVSSSGAYQAGAAGNAVDVVTVTDSLGAQASASVVVTAGVSISPGSALTTPSANLTFTATGGSGKGWTWSFSTNASGGSIGSSGNYTAGITGGVTDVVQVTDSLGNSASASVSVSPAEVTNAPSGGCSTAGPDLPLLLLGLGALLRRRRTRPAPSPAPTTSGGT